MKVSDKKEKVISEMNGMSRSRDRYIRKNRYYYGELLRLLSFNIPNGSTVLEIGCGTGFLLANLRGIKGVGVDISEKMVETAKQEHPDLTFICDDAEDLAIRH